MLYCPKCRRTYENGTQRFCDNDGGRLLPAPSTQNGDSQTGGLFSNLSEKTSASDEAGTKNGSAAPRFIPLNKTEETDKKPTSFPAAGRISQSEQFLEPKKEEAAEPVEALLELDPFGKREEKALLKFEPMRTPEENVDAPPAETPKPLPRLIRPNEIASGTADIGNRRKNPLGRQALSWENPEVLLGKTVKGRYQIIEELNEADEDSLIYLAEDKIVAGKRVVVRVFMNDRLGDDEEKIFAEERVSLSHLKHPNIAGVFDSGELQEGNAFIVSEFVAGESIAEILRHAGQFDVLRTARIVRQTSYALSEAHQNGILHRNLKSSNIVLTSSETGIELVKLMNFGVSRGEITDANFAYKAPEEIEKGISTYASDIYALGVIAYEMLNGRLPFNEKTENAQLKAQKNGLALLPTSLKLDLRKLAGKILQKALSFSPSARYPKARDFGDAFFNALATAAPWTKDYGTADSASEVEEIEQGREFFVVPPRAENEVQAQGGDLGVDRSIASSVDQPAEENSEVKINEPPACEKRSPEPPQKGSFLLGGLAISAVAAGLLGLWGVSRYGISRFNANPPPENVLQATNQNETEASPAPGNPPPFDADMPPQPRLQTPPPNAVRFQNIREDLHENLARNFLGFEIFYPRDWKRAETATNFLDISRRDSSNLPIEQLIVTSYESRGTMTLDRPNFPKLVEKSNQDLQKSLGESYAFVSEGETTIQNGRWRVYEVKFQSSSENERGEKITVWGRRLWLPVQSAGEPNGFVITLLVMSLSDEVKGVDEVGARGELARVLDTFEPELR